MILKISYDRVRKIGRHKSAALDYGDSRNRLQRLRHDEIISEILLKITVIIGWNDFRDSLLGKEKEVRYVERIS